MKFIIITTFLLWSVCSTHSSSNNNIDFIKGESSQYVLEDPLAIYRNDDHSSSTPRLSAGGRVIDLINGEFFDEHLRDTPDHMRPPSIVAFYNSSNKECMNEYNLLNFETTVKNRLPSRAFLFTAKYDIGAANHRTWYKFIPERDLVKRFGVNKCPSIVFIPSNCNGFTKWCINNIDNETGIEYLGCDQFIDQCKNEYKIWTSTNNNNKEENTKGSWLSSIWNGNTRAQEGKTDNDNNWIDWIENLLDNSPAPSLGGPKMDGPHKEVFHDMKEQEDWLLSRDESTQRENYRNNWVSSALPGFTELGYKAVQMSDDHLREMRQFYEKWRHKRRPENWRSKTQTAVNGHVVEPSMVSMDEDMQFRDYIANKYIKPVLEEWVGIPLKLTSHYGIREYYDGSWLKNHIDRIDVLIISATQSIGHLTCNTSESNNGYCDDNDLNTPIDWESGWPENVEWPLEGVDWNGNNIRYSHKPGTMILYESAKFIHGRPYPLPQHPNYPNEKYVHLGAFCHFTPADGSWSQRGHPSNARENLNRHVLRQGRSFKATSKYQPSKAFLREQEGHVPSPVNINNNNHNEL